jgi:hypothetical protein
VKRPSFVLALVAALLGLSLFATPAFAAGLALPAGSLAPADQAALSAEVAKARASDPRAFEQVRRIAEAAPRLDAEKRGRFAPMGTIFSKLGARAVLPALELLALDDHGLAGLAMTPSARLALRVGLLEASGLAGDARGTATLAAILAHPADDETVRAAATALGREGTDAAARVLVAEATRDGRRLALLEGMGECRRAAVASFLAAELAKSTDAARTRALARGLMHVGNAWAWQTPSVRASGEDRVVRPTAARALVAAYARLADEDLRETIAKALLVVDEPTAAALVEGAKASANADAKAALDRLSARLAKNPLHG